MLTLTLIGVTLIFSVRPAMASGTIYIRADGSIDPPTAPISSLDDITYTFTDDIYDSIVVERSNIIIDGNGHTLQGSGSGKGFSWNSINNVTVKRTNIKDFQYGIFFLTSSDSNIFENTVANNSWAGIFLVHAENSSVFGNFVTNNNCGIGLEIEVNFNRIVGNKIVNNSADGIFVNDQSNHNSITENYVAGNAGGIYIGPLPCSGNFIFHNDFINNANYQAIIASMYGEPSINTWDDGYPSGGNYWSDYISRYSEAQGLDDSGIWNTPYNIDENNQDNYPLMEPWTPTPPTPTEVLEELIETIEAWNLPKGTENSLTSKLEEALHALDKGNENGASHKLTSFINHALALRDKKLTEEQADFLISDAQRIIDLINE